MMHGSVPYKKSTLTTGDLYLKNVLAFRAAGGSVVPYIHLYNLHVLRDRAAEGLEAGNPAASTEVGEDVRNNLLILVRKVSSNLLGVLSRGIWKGAL